MEDEVYRLIYYCAVCDNILADIEIGENETIAEKYGVDWLKTCDKHPNEKEVRVIMETNE